ncbi:uncharacterized protein [Onthophagus taurus]|uniref:uncharacterized protein n=1 Tax=Onthophagus taurus TaxID=166361 RepID=UPI000C206981|nr:uncharacterized protein LOC111421068 [Onthophagus taurus]
MDINKLKRFFSAPSSEETGEVGNAQPEIGFKLTYFERTQQLVVKVIGARNLPKTYGTLKPEGYLIKVTIFPGKDKLETEISPHSWPTFNQELTFNFHQNAPTIKDQFLGKFITLTVYAILDNPKQQKTNRLSRSQSLRKSFKLLVGIGDDVQVRNTGSSKYSSNRFTFNNRRTIGAVTYSLDHKKFTQKGCSTHATPDIWRILQSITSGVDTEKREARCNLEVSLSYFNSEDGNNDRMEISLSKLKCSMQAMEEHEKLGGSLYLKITAFEYGVRIASWKSDRFDPTISMKIEPTTATLRAIFQYYNLSNVKIVIRFICKNLLAKKIVLGKVELGQESEIFKEAVNTPSVAITKTLILAH